MPLVDFAALNPAYLNAFGQTVNYQPLQSGNFDCLAIESKPRSLEGIDDNRPSYWFNLPADLTNAVTGRDLQVRPGVGDLAVINGKTYVVIVDPHSDGAGGVWLTFEIE
jgi:hypothetical protein